MAGKSKKQKGAVSAPKPDEADMNQAEMKQAEPVSTSQASGSNIIHVRLCHPGAVQFPLDRETITVNGSNMDIVRRQDDGTQYRHPLETGTFGKTVLNKSTWEAIEARYGHKKLFKNGFIFACENEADADARVNDYCGEKKHGLDPVDPKKTFTRPKARDDEE